MPNPYSPATYRPIRSSARDCAGKTTKGSRMATKPTAPKHLSTEARKMWARLTADYVLDDAGGMLLLQSACEAYDRLQEARRLIDKEGAVQRDRWGQAKPHPACGIERDARTQMHSALRLLKLAPGDAEG